MQSICFRRPPLAACLAFVLVWSMGLTSAAGQEDEVLKVTGERLAAPVSFANGQWTAGAARLAAHEVLCVRFTS